MKIMTCRELGGECDLQISASSMSEMALKMETHVTNVHPNIFYDIRSMTPTQRERWEASLHEGWRRAPVSK